MHTLHLHRLNILHFLDILYIVNLAFTTRFTSIHISEKYQKVCFIHKITQQKNTCIKHMRTLAICRNVQLSNTALVYLIHLSDASPESLCRISNLLCPVCHFTTYSMIDHQDYTVLKNNTRALS